MDDHAARIAHRRATWTGGVAKDAVEMESVSTEWWLTMTPEERIGCVFDMWAEQGGEGDVADEAASRLSRAVGGVRPRKG